VQSKLKMDIEKYMIPCINKKIFGVDCLGCGLQRAFILVIKGDFIAAFDLFPAIYSTILFVVVVLLNFKDKKRNYHKIIIILALINVIIMVASYFYKFFNHN
jgi:uncharacterized membrane protein